MSSAWLRAGGVILALAACGRMPVAAQQVQPQAEEVDSSRIRILERLRRLGRAPGSDSVLFVQDSLRLAQAAEGNRPGAMGAALDSIAAEP